MQIKITTKLKDYTQFTKELKNNKKEFNFLYKAFGQMHCFLLFFILSLVFITIFLQNLLIYIITIFSVIALYLICAYNINKLFAIEQKMANPVFTSLSIREDKYFELGNCITNIFIEIENIERFFKTEDFYAILILQSGCERLILIKKEEINSDEIKNKLINITNEYIKQKKSKFYFINKHALTFLLIFCCLFLEGNFIKYLYEYSKYKQGVIIEAQDTPITITKQKILFIKKGSTHYKEGLRRYDVLISINDIDVASLSVDETEKMLKEKNIKLKVFRSKTTEYKEYTINTD